MVRRALGRSQVVRQRILIPPFEGSSPSAPASKSLFLQYFLFWREMRANTRPLLRAAPSPYRKTEDEEPDFGVCLRGPILVSRFHKRSNGYDGGQG